jgi:uncharacterized membrane protein YfcA
MGRASAIRRSGLCGRGTFVLKVSALRAPSLPDITQLSVSRADRSHFARRTARTSGLSPGRLPSSAALPDCAAVSALDLLLLVCAGVGAGLAGSIAGLASLVSYPALLAVGLGPVTANVTNTVGLVFSSLGSTLGSRTELRGQAPHVRALAVAAVLGGGVGAALLLITPSGTFELIAPWLIGVASLTIVLRPRVQAAVGVDSETHTAGPGLLAGVFLVGIYGGYFGAAAGVMLLALLLTVTHDTLARSNALKNAVLGIANATAALAFCLLTPVAWSAIAPLAVGLFAGARLGPTVVRHANAAVLRTLIGLAGIALAVKLGADAY